MISRIPDDLQPPAPPPPFPDSGILPVLPPDGPPERHPRNNAATGASAAGVRALSAQLVSFYFRAPAKAFFRTRVDYLAYARALHDERMLQQQLHLQQPRLDGMPSALRRIWLWMRSTTPGVLTSAVKHDGWRVLPHQVLPPLMANVGVGIVLYTSYLQILGRLHPESSRAHKRVFPPPSPAQTLAAGFLAGSIQSVFAAPLDALQARSDRAGARPGSLWVLGAERLREMGLRGVFAGWGLSLAKDSLGCAVFFSTFEYVKAQGYYRFVRWYYAGLDADVVDLLAHKRPAEHDRDEDRGPHGRDGAGFRVIRPHYALEPAFLLAAGISASLAQQLLLHPLTLFQLKHRDHLEELDRAAKTSPAGQHGRWSLLRSYCRAYRETWAACSAEAASDGLGLARWLYRGFWWNTIRQVPSTSAGLIIFELIRRKYGFGADEVKIQQDGYNILLH